MAFGIDRYGRMGDGQQTGQGGYSQQSPYRQRPQPGGQPGAPDPNPGQPQAPAPQDPRPNGNTGFGGGIGPGQPGGPKPFLFHPGVQRPDGGFEMQTMSAPPLQPQQGQPQQPAPPQQLPQGQSQGQAPQFQGPEGYQPQNVQYQEQQYNPYQFNWSPQAQSYQAGNISQFQGPNQAPTEGQMHGLVSNLMSQGGSMGPAWMAGQQEKMKEQQLQMQQQMQGQLGQNAALHGMTNSGGYNSGLQRMSENLVGNLTGQYRDLASQAATQNYQDQMGALGMGNDLLNSQMNRATQGFGSQFQGQMGQQQLNQAQAGSQLDVMHALDSRQQAQQGEHQFAGNYRLQNAQNAANFGLQNQQLQMQGGQNRFGNALAGFGANEGVRQFNANSANQFAQNANLNQQNLIKLLLGQ